MEKVYLLHHVHEFDDGHEDVKLIGVFSSAEAAKAAWQRVADQPGFKDVPDGFSVNEHVLDRLGWVEGYVTWHPGDPPSE